MSIESEFEVGIRPNDEIARWVINRWLPKVADGIKAEHSDDLNDLDTFLSKEAVLFGTCSNSQRQVVKIWLRTRIQLMRTFWYGDSCY